MKSGADIKIFETEDKKIKFGVLICIDYLKINNQTLKEKVQFIFNPTFNQDVKRFQKQADLDCQDFQVDLLQVNATKYGGTCVIGIDHKNVIQRLVKEGFRQDDGIDYKLCEANNEMMLLFNLSSEPFSLPSPLDAKPRISDIKQYIYRNRSWKQDKNKIFKRFETGRNSENFNDPRSGLSHPHRI